MIDVIQAIEEIEDLIEKYKNSEPDFSPPRYIPDW